MLREREIMLCRRIILEFYGAHMADSKLDSRQRTCGRNSAKLIGCRPMTPRSTQAGAIRSRMHGNLHKRGCRSVPRPTLFSLDPGTRHPPSELGAEWETGEPALRRNTKFCLNVHHYDLGELCQDHWMCIISFSLSDVDWYVLWMMFGVIAKV